MAAKAKVTQAEKQVAPKPLKKHPTEASPVRLEEAKDKGTHLKAVAGTVAAHIYKPIALRSNGQGRHIVLHQKDNSLNHYANSL